MTRLKWIGLVGVLVGASFSSSLRSAPPVTTYQPTDLGTIGGAYSYSHAINDVGAVVGRSYDVGGGPPQPFVWQNGVLTQLPVLPGMAWGEANGINNNGVVAGTTVAAPSPSGTLFKATRWVGNVPAELPNEPTRSSWAYGINDAGDIVGQSDFRRADGALLQGRATVWTGGTRIDLGPLPNQLFSEARGINNVGQVVGWSWANNGNDQHAVLWQNGTVVDLTPGLDGSATALGINDAGLVVGYILDNGGGTVGFYWQNGTLTVLDNSLCPLCGTGSSANSVNQAGAIAIQAGTRTNAPVSHVLLNGEVSSLPGTFTNAIAVNNLGQVAGFITNGHATLWTPNAATTQLAANPVSGVFNGTTSLSATLTAGGTGVAGKTIAFSLFGTNVGAAVTDASGTATLNFVSLSGHAAGTYPAALQASFAGDGQYLASSGGADATIASNGTDDVAGLIAMILAANASPGPDTISLAPNATYTLTTAYSPTNGLPPITGDLTIVGNGATITRSTAPGTPEFRIMTVNLPTQASVVTMSNLTISNGKGSGDFRGGGIFLIRGTLNLDDAQIKNNAATGGGGINTNTGTTLHLTRTIVSGNVSDDPSLGGSGGGIYNYQGTVTLTDSTISSNTARSSGGIFNYQGPLTMLRSAISGNATSINGTGGGLTVYESTVTILNSSVSGNTAHDGAGIFNFGTLIVDQSTISGNTAAIKGGGIYSDTGGTLTVTNSTVSNNNAHSASAPTSGYGGGIFNWGGSTATIANSTIYGNFTNFGGAGLYNNGTMVVKNVTVANNNSTQFGSGLLNDSGGTATIGNTILAGNYLQRNCAVVGPNLTSAGGNLSDGGSCTGVFTQTSDANNVSAGLDPAGLKNNGGPTQTVALVAGSPAIETGNDAVCAAPPVNGVDQRGVTRPDGAHCDKGAFEAPGPDTIPPVISCAAPDGLWHGNDVALQCTASDSSGLQSPADASFTLVTAVPVGTETSNAATSSRVVCDSLGNCATAGPVVGNKIDKRPPTATIVQPTNGSYLLNQVALANLQCADGGSGLVTCAGTASQGVAFDTTSVGTHVFSLTATDAVGNSSSATVTYTVVDPTPGATARWIKVDGAAPSPRAGHQMVYDSFRHKVILFGGQTSQGCCGGEQNLTGQLLNDMWEWDAATSAWTQITPASGPVPSPRSFFGMGYDPVRHKVLLFGGKPGPDYWNTDGETWEWDPATRLWTNFPGASTLDFGGRRDVQLAFDPVNNQMLLFGGKVYWGDYSGNTWLWNGATWVQLPNPSPSGRIGHTLATDFSRSKIVLYGGESNLGTFNDTWEWNGLSWTQVSANGALQQRGFAGMAVDPTRGLSVLYGGSHADNAPSFTDTWRWMNGAWTQQLTSANPPAIETSLAFDGLHIMLFGGHAAAGPIGQTWILVPAESTPPTIQCAAADGLWHNADVSIACTASDASGLQNPADSNFTLVTSVAAGTETANAQTNSRTVCDTVGNCATAGPIVGIKIDKRPPTIAIASPSASAYRLEQIVPANFSCADSGSGVASCAGAVPSGTLIPTSATGTFTFDVQTADALGNAATASVSYTVVAGVPGDGIWHTLQSLPYGRYGLAAASVNGLVYAIGGVAQAPLQVFGIGNFARTEVAAYDPLTNTWTSVAPLPFGRVYANGASVIGNKIYLPGGGGPDAPGAGESNSIWIFDPSTGPIGAWTAGPSMPVRSMGGASGAIGNNLYVLQGRVVDSRFFRLDTITGVWTELTAAPRNHTFGAGATVGGKFYAAGGEASRTALDIFDPATGAWTTKEMPVGFQHHTAVALNGKLYLAGGDQFLNGSYLGTENIVMAYDPQTDSWMEGRLTASLTGPTSGQVGESMSFLGSSTHPLAAVPERLNIPAAAAIGNMFFIVGGGNVANTAALPSVYAANPPAPTSVTLSWNFGDGGTGTGPSGSHAYSAPGTYIVTLTATGSDGRTATATRSVTIQNPIQISVPSNMTVEATAPAGAIVTFVVSATDPSDPAPSISCSRGSGSQFALGSTTVNCTATNNHGQSASGSFMVTVRDTVAPVAASILPNVESLLVTSSVNVTIFATDAVGVAGVTVNGVSLTRTSGTPQSGAWTGAVPVTPFAAAALTATVTDGAQNAGTRLFTFDNDGIDASIDRDRLNYSIDRSAVYSRDFNNGVTAGTIGTGGPVVLAAPGLTPTDPWVTLVMTPYSPNPAVTSMNVDVCAGALKQIHFDQPDERVLVRCTPSQPGSETLWVAVKRAFPTIEVLKHISVCHFLTCSHYVAVTTLRTGQEFSTGSPFAASADNTEPIHVEIRRVNDDGSETAVGSFDLDPGEIADMNLTAGATEHDDTVVLSVLSGTVTVTIGTDTLTVGEGTSVTARVEKLAQVISFGSLANKSFGDAAFGLTASASSGLPVSYAAAGTCSVAGTTLTITGAGSCAVTASQPGDLNYLPAVPVSQAFSVWYSWSGLLQPVNANGTSIFKLGSTVPLKFQLTGAGATVTNLAARIYIAKVSNSVIGDEVEALSTGNADAGNLFRYDAQSGQYIFNWGTKGLTEGTWQIRVDLLDGNGSRTVLVSLKK